MKSKKKFSAVLGIISSVGLTATISATAQANQPTANEYDIYPNVQKIEYNGKKYIITDNVNIVYEDGVDQATIKRLESSLISKNISFSRSRRVIEGKTNILVGTKDNADTLVDELAQADNIQFSDELKQKNDSYILNNVTNKITLLAKDNKAAFYGATTLWHVFSQLNGQEIKEFSIEDYADVRMRGIFEGFFGSQWTKEQRIEYLEWASHYKLNSYVYASKEDSKHWLQWRDLYSQSELDNDIKPLIEKSKQNHIDFVYTLHPFARQIPTIANYEADLTALKNKFSQVIEAGARSIGLLANDFIKPFYELQGDNSGDNKAQDARRNATYKEYQKKLLEDLVAWLKELKNTYTDLNTNIKLLVNEYKSEADNYFNTLPVEVEIVVSGNNVKNIKNYDENAYLENFKQTANRKPVLLFDWAANDKSKANLVLGGFKDTFTTQDRKDKIDGVLVSPMQQAQASRIALFGAASYSWKNWNNEEQIAKTLDASFNHLINGSKLETQESIALRELAKHLVNKASDSSVKLEESVELKEELNTFKAKLADKSYSLEEIDSLINKFKAVVKHATRLQASKQNAKLLKEIMPWINSAKDLFNGLALYLEALKENKSATKNDDLYTELYNNALELIEKSRSYRFNYLDYSFNAEVGSQHIQPLLKEVKKVATDIYNEILDRSHFNATFSTNRQVKQGSSGDVFRLDNTSQEVYSSSHDGAHNRVKKDDYFEATINKPITLNSLYIKMGDGNDKFKKFKIQYKVENSETWTDLNGHTEVNKTDNTPYEVNGLNVQNVVAVRVTNLEENTENSWLRVTNFVINSEEQKNNSGISVANANNPQNLIFGKLHKTNISHFNDYRHNLGNFDGDLNTSTIIAGSLDKGQYIVYDLGAEVNLESIRIYAGTAFWDYPRDIDVYFSTKDTENEADWTKAFEVGDDKIDTNQNLDLYLTEEGAIDLNYPNQRYWGNDNVGGGRARYIKFVLKANYPEGRWFNITEIVVNKGTYISLENDSRFSGNNHAEVDKNSTPAKLDDNYLNTAYTPAKANGDLTYTVKENYFNNKDLRIITKGENSNAVVKAIVVDKTTNQESEVELGTLSHDVTDFRLPLGENQKIKALKFAWSDKRPSIAEIQAIDTNTNTNVNKDELTNLINTQPTNYDSWTQDSKDEYEQAKQIAQNVINSPYVKQSTVDSVKKLVEKAIADATSKGNYEKLQQIVDTKISNDDEIYTPDSYSKYLDAYNNVKVALDSKQNLTQEQIDDLIAKYNEAKDALADSDLQKQKATLNTNKFDALNEKHFEAQGYQDLKTLVEQIKQKVADTNTKPIEFKELNTKFDRLVSRLKQNDLGKIASQYNDTKQLADTFLAKFELKWPEEAKLVKDSLQANEAIAANSNATKEQLQQALDQLKSALNQANEQRDSKIYELKQLSFSQISNENGIYTPESYKPYQDTFAKLNNLLQEPAQISKQDANAIIAEIKSKQDALVLAADSLDKAKTTARSILEQIKDKGDFATRIDNATQENIKALLDELSTKLAEQKLSELKQASDLVKAKVNLIKDITKKQQILDELDKALTTDQTSVLDQQADKIIIFETKKAELETKLDQVTNQAQKDEFQDEINQAKTIEKLTEIESKINDVISASKTEDSNNASNVTPSTDETKGSGWYIYIILAVITLGISVLAGILINRRRRKKQN
ncbi:beta-N-acetylglucosaminidase domain-containing protein [Mycoplasma simbae]|uniref:beta-N-acetylglucosaminidase domain-containing protein n=1 Tax=Mycoplasma simbae TaxID=36744 RepID=UPI00055E2551|nr:beta-N-acetylglucosaminidase domain-containing protein [Mycoplasma simbae]